MHWLLMLTYLVLVAAPAGVWIHESGHAIGSWFCRAEYMDLTLGAGKRIKEVRIGRKLTVHFHLLFTAGGHASSSRTHPYSRVEKVIISLGGPACNLAAGWLLMKFVFESNAWIRLFALYNLWIAMVNFIPFKWRGKKSDGYFVLRTIIDGRQSG
ncbi:hypothetical protein ERJ70_10585 [Sediminibacillus dalangtanensis]|uniref:Peptidase M50 domain-containing protein n=1 Tax=Sediminibacillus dalangtanensis TaxID=2729421 RepID=A0ABX7VT55_9BACI|nr:hypothetical protein [Sediminibacillus dalangtanensis]QTM99708.1 hypothetical protein ERJ70_10585 [Sediminibacillus dalangtanensis]